MAIKERDVVLMGKDGANQTIDLPVTRLGIIEADAEVKTTLGDADAVPVVDSADAQEMKKITWTNLVAAIKSKLGSVYAAAKHTHGQGDVTGLATALAGKSDSGHTHTAEQVAFTDGETFQTKLDAGKLTGPAGKDGATGAKGATGATGPKGDKGDPGTAGQSAYQQAVAAGYTGTEAAFYAALVSMKDAPFLPLSGGTMTGDVDFHDSFCIHHASSVGVGSEKHGWYIVSVGSEELPVAEFDGTSGDAPVRLKNISTPTASADAANKQYVDNLSAYDVVIRTQAEFEKLIASPTWLGAVSVCFAGDGGTLKFTRSDGQGIKIPQTVRQIQGMNGAIIEVTNFMRSTANQGALWYETLPTGDDYWIDGMIANCIGTGEGDGFYNCVQLTNCTGTTTCMASGGFSACTRLTNCTGTGTGDYGYGFYNCVQLTNCTGASAEDGSDFYKCEYLSGCKSGKTSSATVLFEACNFVNLTGENQLVFTGKTVAVSAWSANSTYSAQGYAYRASVACTGVTASHRPDVAFGAADAVGGNFAPVADSYAGGVYIYCKTKPTATVTIPSIVCVKGA